VRVKICVLKCVSWRFTFREPEAKVEAQRKRQLRSLSILCVPNAAIIIMGKIPGSAHVNLSLGGLVMVGGAYGYWKKGSTPSLVAGLTIGSLLLGSGYMIATNSDRMYEAHCMAIAMGGRFVSTGKFMPAGMVATLGALGCAYNLQKALEWAPGKKE
jgi:uncharacterized membrane protein (UPF0136 family)